MRHNSIDITMTNDMTMTNDITDHIVIGTEQVCALPDRRIWVQDFLAKTS